MKLWHLPAAELPVTLRPFGGETVVSYARRLSEANALTHNAVLRALGDISPFPARPLLYRYDVRLNEPAVDRLEALTGLGSARLSRALPALRGEYRHALPTDRPRGRCFPAYPRPACSQCVKRRATGPAMIRIDMLWQVCRPHRRWLLGAQHDLSPTPAILAAHHRYRQYLRSHDHHNAAWVTVTSAQRVALGWAQGRPWQHPVLTERFRARADALGLKDPAHPAVVLPETVALAHVLSDPVWRRHAAMADQWAMGPFHRQVAAATGADRNTLIWHWLRDPLGSWLFFHRDRYARYREEYTSFSRFAWSEHSPYPPVEHFAFTYRSSRQDGLD